jgi:murein L,D-transpeptidase YafK
MAVERVDRLIIYKGRHRMEAWAGKRMVKVYRVAIGRGGAGAKLREGDNRTPEGSYRMVQRRVSAAFHRFLLLSYPSSADRAAFRKAQREGTIPRSARIGGDIGVHGEKKGLRLLPHKWVDWTQGCVAVDNDEIEELYATVVDHARVDILP